MVRDRDREEKRTYSIKEASVYSEIKPKTLYYLINKGEIEAIRIGKITLLDGDDLNDLLDKNKGLQKKQGTDINDLIEKIISIDIKP